MVDLIRALIQVKTPLTLFAFVSLVFLAAFRTRRVPELFFELAKGKLTRDEFARLVHRFMLFGFAAFVLVCGVAVASNVLAYKAKAKPASLDELRKELHESDAAADQREAALKSYADGLAFIQQHDFAQAIQSLQQSIAAIPSLSAQTTLAYLYQKQGDEANAKKYTAAAQSLASQRGDSVAQLRLEQMSDTGRDSASTSMVGDKSPFPNGGKSFEEAVPISPGRYITSHDLAGGQFQYYRMGLKAGQTLRIDFRSPDSGGNVYASIYNSNGVFQQGDGISGRSVLKTVRWPVSADGLLYLSLGNNEWGNAAGGVYLISIE
jgi:tetratricopeptide (TPR) repeat protein